MCIRDSPFFTQNNVILIDFMIRFLEFLKPRKFVRGEMIFNEFDSPTEMYFVMSGKYDVGYSLNGKKYYCF